jgi:hypothetical protein
MRDLQAVFDDLADAEDPVEWAIDNLALIGRGSAAYVFEHPEDAAYVLRLSEYPDGWFGYAEDTLSLIENGTPCPHRPRVTALWVIDGVFAAVGERLEEIGDGTTLADAVDVITSALRSRLHPDGAESLVPGFAEFVTSLDARLDARPENFMRRGEVLVYNDPYSALSFDREKAMREAFAYPARPSAVMPPARPCHP